MQKKLYIINENVRLEDKVINHADIINETASLQLSRQARRHPEVKETAEEERTSVVRLRHVSSE